MTQSFIQNNLKVLNYNQQVQAEFRKLCEPFLRNLKVKRFAYCIRFLDDVGLCRNYKIIDLNIQFLPTVLFRLENEQYGYTNTELIKMIRLASLGSFNHYVYTQSACPYTTMVQQKFKISTGVLTFKRSANYIETWCLTFGEAGSFPMVLTDDFRIYILNFIKYLNGKIGQLLNHAPMAEMSSPVELSYNSCAMPNFAKFIQNPSQDYSFIIKDKEITFTNRQWECMLHLSKGKSYKEIGSLLNISPRTVEHHFNVIKEKMNCNYKSEILNIFHNKLLI